MFTAAAMGSMGHAIFCRHDRTGVGRRCIERERRRLVVARCGCRTDLGSFRKAKPDEIKPIEPYGEAVLATFSFSERDKLMRLAIQLMQVDMRAEANALLKQIDSLEEADANLATVICKPR
jgi:hypothetical protein